MLLVSVILPVYNVEKYVEASLRSVINQTYSKIECIVVDDCGTDRSMKVVEEVLRFSDLKGKNFKILHHEKNRGPSAARNTGLNCASGDYLFFLDSDDTISPDCIEKHILAISKTQADFSVGNTHLVGGKSIHIFPTKIEICHEIPLLSFLRHDWNVSVGNKLFRTDFVKRNKLKFTEGLIFEDVLWNFCVARVARNLCVAEDAFYDYYIRKNSITKKKNDRNKIESMIYIIREISCENKDYSLEVRELLAKYCGRLKFNAALLLFNFNGPFGVQKVLYSELQSLPGKGLFNSVLALPFTLFVLLFKPIYTSYKCVSKSL